MSMKYIRDTYNVPAKRGMEINFKKCEHQTIPNRGVIIGSKGHYLKVRFRGNLGVFNLHPSWMIEYLQ